MSNVIKIKRGSGSDPAASDMVLGEPVLRTDTAELFFKKDDGSVAKVSGGGGGPDFKYLELRNAANNGAASYPGNDFTLVSAGTTSAVTPTAANTLLVSVSGVIQKPNSGTSTSGITGFIVDGSRLKTATNLPAAPDFIIYQESGGIGEPSDNTVSTDKIIDEAVTLAKLEHGTVNNNGKFLRANNGADPTFETISQFVASNVIGLYDQGGTPVQRLLASTEGVTVQGTSSAVSKLMFRDRTTANFLKFKPVDTLSADVEFTLPSADGSANTVLKTDGSGVMSFGTIVNASVDASAAIAGTKVSPSFGNQDIVTTGNLDLSDSTGNGNNRIKLGTDDDLKIYHDGSDSRIQDSSNLKITTDNLVVLNAAETQYILRGLNGSSVELYEAGNKKFETTTTGVSITGNIVVSGNVDGRDLATDGSKLDGIASGATNVTNTNQLTNGAGFITATLTNEQVQDIVGGMVSSNTESGITVTYQDGDGTLDFAVASQTDNNFTNADHSKLDGIEAGATADQTASEILTLLKTVDGSGSGLDADTLDGISIASLLRSDTSDTLTGATYTFNSSTDQKIILSGSSNPYISFKESSTEKAYIQWNAAGWLQLQNQESGEDIRIKSGADGLIFRHDGTESKVFHAGNDGASSGLDADLLDGQHGSHYLNYNNLSNRPTIPTNNNQLTNGAGYITSAPAAPGAAKKWINFNGGNGSIRDDVGISSVTYHSTGQYTLNFDGNMANTNYSVSGFCFRNGSGRVMAHVDTVSTYTTSALRVMVSGTINAQVVGLSVVNPTYVFIQIWGDT